MSFVDRFKRLLDSSSADEIQDEALARSLHWEHSNTLITTLVVINLAIVVFQAVFQTVMSFSTFDDMVGGIVSAINIFTICDYCLFVATAAALVGLYLFNRRGQFHRARMLTRGIIVLLVAGFFTSIVVNGATPILLTYLFQFVCVVAYQLYNDPVLARPLHFSNPFSRKPDADPYAHRKAYIPLDFFNIFWVFIIASFLGLCIEMVFCLFVNNVWESRQGLLLLPLSPIYGAGAVLLTVALNRVWNKNIALIFLVSAIAGAFVEFAVSWYMETAFGVLAWDYKDEFLNIQGRTDFAHALAWGALGLVWIRLLLPGIMRTMRAIPLHWRALVTTTALVVFLFDGIMTLEALDCWSARCAGVPVQTAEQQFFAEHFDDAFMQEHFSNMGMSQSSAARAQAAADAKADIAAGVTAGVAAGAGGVAGA